MLFVPCLPSVVFPDAVWGACFSPFLWACSTSAVGCFHRRRDRRVRSTSLILTKVLYTALCAQGETYLKLALRKEFCLPKKEFPNPARVAGALTSSAKFGTFTGVKHKLLELLSQGFFWRYFAHCQMSSHIYFIFPSKILFNKKLQT